MAIRSATPCVACCCRRWSGYAPTEVTIAGVLHEYSAIDGVQEDVVNMLLNLKGVVFKLHNRDEVTLVAAQGR